MGKRNLDKAGRENWLSDDAVTHCGMCSARFRTLLRRHHCRACGDIFCWRCSDNAIHYTPDTRKREEHYLEKKKRVCDACFRNITEARRPVAEAEEARGEAHCHTEGSGTALTRGVPARAEGAYAPVVAAATRAEGVHAPGVAAALRVLNFPHESAAVCLPGVRPPPALSAEERRDVERAIARALSELGGEFEGTYYPMAPPPGRPAQGEGPACPGPPGSEGRGVFAGAAGDVAVWVNAEHCHAYIAVAKCPKALARLQRVADAIRGAAGQESGGADGGLGEPHASSNKNFFWHREGRRFRQMDIAEPDRVALRSRKQAFKENTTSNRKPAGQMKGAEEREGPPHEAPGSLAEGAEGGTRRHARGPGGEMADFLEHQQRRLAEEKGAPCQAPGEGKGATKKASLRRSLGGA